MKILHIISQSPDFTGSGKFIREIIGQSKKKGNENYLVAGAQADFEMPESLIEKENCIFVRFDGKDLSFPVPGMSDVMPYESTVFSKFKKQDFKEYKKVFKQKIQKAVAKFKPDILHTHHLWVVSALAREIAPDIPMVTTCHGTCLRQHSLCPGMGGQMKNLLEKIDQIIVLSHDQKKKALDLLDVDPSCINIISGGYNKEYFFYKPKKLHSVVEILYAGKLSSAKGVPWLLKSLTSICDLPFWLHIAGSGSGSQKEECMSLMESSGSKVVYHGPLSHDKLGKLMQRSHIFVLPSFYEGLPLVLMEALSCGCRIIATALPGVKEIFGKGHETMVTMVDLPKLETIDSPFEKDLKELEALLAATLAQGIESVLENDKPDLEYVRSASLGFTWEKIFSRIESVYERVFQSD